LLRNSPKSQSNSVTTKLISLSVLDIVNTIKRNAINEINKEEL